MVEELVSSPGKSEIGVRRGLATILLTKVITSREAGNKRMESPWRRDFVKYSAWRAGVAERLAWVDCVGRSDVCLDACRRAA